MQPAAGPAAPGVEVSITDALGEVARPPVDLREQAHDLGLHRERLPNLTHQLAIVALLELAGEVEDAYEKILGSS